jgi:hypothetical protein
MPVDIKTTADEKKTKPGRMTSLASATMVKITTANTI